MKACRAIQAGFLGLALAAISVGSASALTLTADRVAGYYSGVGGEFTIFGTGYEFGYDVKATAVKSGVRGFQSFCLERNETITVPGAYNYTQNDFAMLGGYGGGNPDPLSIGTAYLYNSFARGVLAGYNWTPGTSRQGSAGLLQQAFWYLEDELSLTSSQISANSFLSAVVSQYGSLAAGKTTASSSQLNVLGVHVLNLTSASGAPRQSQLVYVPGGIITPDGGVSATLLGLSLLGLNRLRRRFAAE